MWRKFRALVARKSKHRPKGISRSEVVRLRDGGMTLPGIAGRLGCSESCVGYHLYRRKREAINRDAAERRKTRSGRKWFREYYMGRYRAEPEFRRRHLERTARYDRQAQN